MLVGTKAVTIPADMPSGTVRIRTGRDCHRNRLAGVDSHL